MTNQELEELRGMVKETTDLVRKLIADLADESIPKGTRFMAWLTLDQILVKGNNETQKLIDRLEKEIR